MILFLKIILIKYGLHQYVHFALFLSACASLRHLYDMFSSCPLCCPLQPFVCHIHTPVRISPGARVGPNKLNLNSLQTDLYMRESPRGGSEVFL